MKTETKFVVLEYLNEDLQDYILYDSAAYAYEETEDYLAPMVKALEGENIKFTLNKKMQPNGDFLISVRTEQGTYEFEGITHTNIIH
tara:strand:+ start:347 stop:607 length:261 start_codon:yes stop_codon:yes gene_type:complete